MGDYKLDLKVLELINERETALFEIERTFFTKRFNYREKQNNILRPQSISMIYSYWEGYVRLAFNEYVYYLNTLDINFNDFCDEIKIHHMENSFKQLFEYPSSLKKKTAFFNLLNNHFSEERIQLYSNINTENNVGFEVLNKLLETFCLKPMSIHCDAYMYPNPNLKDTMSNFLRYRNSIAHGGDITGEEKVTQELYSKYKRLVTYLMYEVYERMLEGIKYETYLKNNSIG